MKINTDAAIAMDDDFAGVGGVARSANALLGVWCKPYPGVTDPVIAKALALRDGVIFANARGYTHVVMETNCWEVVNLWKTRLNSRSVVASILSEIGELALSFTFFIIQHVNMSANSPEHLCAKRACTLAVTESWLTETPSFLTSSLLTDCSANTFA